VGKTLWRDHLEPNQGKGLAMADNPPVSAYPQRQVSPLEWQRFLTAKGGLDQGEIFSEIIPLRQMDSLLVLQALERKLLVPLNHFYWENRAEKRAILSLGTLRELVLHGANRFAIAQKFIEDQQRKIRKVCQVYGYPSLDIPYFCCGFTFFPEQQRHAPFPAGHVVIPRVQLVRQDQRYFLVLNGDRQHRNHLPRLAQQIVTFLEHLPQQLTPTRGIHQTVCAGSSGFIEGVTEALRLIDQQKLSKVVLAHALDVTASQALDVVNALENLRDRHPDCCVFSLRNRQGDSFIGASPERLLAIHQGELQTDALAGSAPRGKSPQEDQTFAENLLHSEKEQREHQAVANFLMEQLTDIGLTPQVAERTLLKLSNIQHLWTPISAKLAPHIHPLEIVAKLHPTPAVAGVPRAIACDHIRQSESFDRNLYAAPIGWLDAQGNAEFIVAIRSALIRGNHARLYGGAGIVAGSQPEREYAEVQLKLTSLLDALT
jgi:menaquinone-specific isochorismate synthase